MPSVAAVQIMSFDPTFALIVVMGVAERNFKINVAVAKKRTAKQRLAFLAQNSAGTAATGMIPT